MANTKSKPSAAKKPTATKKSENVKNEKIEELIVSKYEVVEDVVNDTIVEQTLENDVVEETVESIKPVEKQDNDIPTVTAEELKDFDFDKFIENPVKQEDIIIVSKPTEVRKSDVQIAKPMFPPSKYSQKMIVKKFH